MPRQGGEFGFCHAAPRRHERELARAGAGAELELDRLRLYRLEAVAVVDDPRPPPPELTDEQWAEYEASAAVAGSPFVREMPSSYHEAERAPGTTFRGLQAQGGGTAYQQRNARDALEDARGCALSRIDEVEWAMRNELE